MVCKDCNKIKARLKASQEQYFLFRRKVEKVLLEFLEDYKDLFESLEKSNKRNKLLTQSIINKKKNIMEKEKESEELLSLFAQGKLDADLDFEDVFGAFKNIKDEIK